MSNTKAKTARKSRKSKRETEMIMFERTVQVCKPYSLDQQGEFPQRPPEQLLMAVIESDKKSRREGNFRLLTSRMITKDTAKHKPRLFSIPYQRVATSTIIKEHAHFVFFGIMASQDEHLAAEERSAHYQIIYFSKPQEAEQCLTMITQLGIGENAREPIPEEPSRSTSAISQEPDAESQLIFQTQCEYSQFDMRLFSSFPDELPHEVHEAFMCEKLEGLADVLVFEDGVILNSRPLDGRGLEKPERLWSGNFDRVYRLYHEKRTNRQFMFAVDDEQNMPNHYNLIRLAKGSDSDQLLSAYVKRKNSADLETVRLTDMPLFQQRQKSSRKKTPPIVAQQVQVAHVKSVPTANTNGHANNNRFIQDTYYHSQNKFKQPQILNKEDLMQSLPGDGAHWEKQVTTIKNDPVRGSLIDEEGSVILFVAHKMA